MASEQKMKCNRCKCDLEEMEIYISYLERNFSHKAPRCPKCGQVYISEDLVNGKISDLEKALEEK